MEYCRICILFYEKSFKSDQIKSVKHQEKVEGYSCKKRKLYMHISVKVLI